MKDKIIHFIISDLKFNKHIIREFEDVLPQKNFFFFLKDCSKSNYIDTNVAIYNYEPQKKEDRIIIEQKTEECLFAIFHTFVPQQTTVYNIVSKKIPVIWCGFGFDFFLFNRDPVTTRSWFFYIMTCPYLGIKGFLCKGILGKIRYKEYVKASNSIQYFGCILPGEYKKAVSSSDVKTEFIYRVDHSEKKENMIATGNNILLAHSGGLDCNHIEGIRLFMKYSQPNQKAVMYLSYGPHLDYTKGIIKKGKALLKDRFIVYDKFMTNDEYIASLQDCSYAFFPYLRQMGLGCINRLLLCGTKIFFYKESILYNYFKGNGLFVYTFENDLKSDTRYNRLTCEEISVNQQKTLELFGSDATKNSINIMYNHFKERQ